MKILGLIGGMSWVSTQDYYKYINEGINERLGGLNFAECFMYSFNYEVLKQHNLAKDTDGLFRHFSQACLKLQAAGAEAIVLCSNTSHQYATALGEVLSVPVIHIGDAITEAVVAHRLKKVALLGTKFTMELPFITEKLAAQGIETLIPGEEDRNYIHETIFEELGRGIILPETREKYLHIIWQLIARGAEGVILGCTEIPLLISPQDVPVPVFDTTKLHAEAAVAFAVQ